MYKLSKRKVRSRAKKLFLVDGDLLGKLETFVYEIMAHESEQPNTYEAVMELVLEQKDRIDELETQLNEAYQIRSTPRPKSRQGMTATIKPANESRKKNDEPGKIVE